MLLLLVFACKPQSPVDSPMDRPPRVIHPDQPRLVITPELATLTADGVASTLLRIQATAPDGSPAQDGTVLPLVSNAGALLELTEVQDGEATARLRAGTWPTAVAFEAEGWEVQSGPLTLEQGFPYSAQLHLHGSFSEGDGTMLGHTIQADAIGINVLWWTDHDHYYLRDRVLEIGGFDFEDGGLVRTIETWPPGWDVRLSWEETTNTTQAGVAAVLSAAAHDSERGFRIGLVPDDPGQISYDLTVHPALNVRPLLAGVDFGFAIKPRRAASADAELRITVELSEPPLGTDGAGTTNRIVFFYSTLPHTNTANVVYIPIDAPAGEWTELSWDLTALVEQYFPDLGADQHAAFATISINGGSQGASWDLDDFFWTQRVIDQELLDVQRAYLASLPYTPTQHVGHEVGFLSEATHVNAYGEGAPLPDLANWAEADWQREIDAVHAAGGLASYNHMFGWEILAGTEEERAELVADRVAELLENEAWGCDLLEVGYRSRGGLLQDFLTVWDQLSMAGIFLTGVGVSDLHHESVWNDFINNFVTWIPSADDSEADLILNLERGMAYFGDPAPFAGSEQELFFTAPDSHATMGQIVVGAREIQTLELSASDLREAWEVRLIVNGEVEETWRVEDDGPARFSVDIDPVGDKVTRFEVWTPSEEGVLFTNPIWFLDEAPAVDVSSRLPQP